MSEWKPIETAPKNKEILVWDGEAISLVEFGEFSECWYDARSEYSPKIYPTHWIDLQPPSKETPCATNSN